MMKKRRPPMPKSRRPVSAAAAQANATRLMTAFALHQQGALDQAEKLYQEILHSQPQHLDALQLLARIALQRNNSAIAVELFDRVLKINPHDPSAFCNRGIALLELKRYDEALESYDRALRLNPDDADAFCNRGTILFTLKRHEEALESYNRALKIKPDHAEALIHCGNVLFALGHLEEALESYGHALNIQPDYSAEALSDHSFNLFELGRPEEALEICDLVLKSRPDHAGTLINRGNALLALGRPQEALESCDHALGLEPERADALSNRGNTLIALGRPQEALESCEQAIRRKPDYADAHWNESLCRLLLGDFALGWQKYEWRWKAPLVEALSYFKQPLWLGKTPLAGKTILLHAEQGLGDTLQFCRYAPLAAAQGASIVLAVPPSLKSLCQTLAGVDTLLTIRCDPLPPFDLHIPLMSLPLAFDTRLDSIPAEVPYLHADPQKTTTWNISLGPRDKPRIGLAWRGRSEHRNDHNRSLSFALLADLLEYPAEFICLQKEFHHEDEALVRQHSRMRVFSEQLHDFADTAALIEALDLVITIDTSVAHLAGALGKPVWILLPFAPDWRWLLDRKDSPWYPSARLFRQQQLGQWAPVLAEVRRALHEI